jgi:hypothetical protein
MAYHKAANNFQVALDGDISPSATTIAVTGSLTPIAFILPVYLSIENEIIEVTGVTGQNMTVIRGVQDTASIGHLSTSTLDLTITAAQINELIDDKQDGGGSVYGSDYSYVAKVGDESTVSVGPVVYHTVTSTTLPAGTYRLENMAVVSGGSASQTQYAQITVDGSISSYMQDEPKEPNNQHTWTTFSQFTLASPATVTINLEYGKIAGNVAVIIKESRITYWRVF